MNIKKMSNSQLRVLQHDIYKELNKREKRAKKPKKVRLDFSKVRLIHDLTIVGKVVVPTFEEHELNFKQYKNAV